MTPIDISKMPDLVRLVEEVEATKTPRALKRDDKVVAVLSPVEKREQQTSHAHDEQQQSLAAIGSWSDLDPDELIAAIYRWREEGSRGIDTPPTTTIFLTAVPKVVLSE